MKIMIVNKFYYLFGGTERYLFNLTDVLESKGHSVIPFAMQHEKNLESPYSKYFVSKVDLSEDRKFNIKNEIRIAARILYSFEAKKKLNLLISHAKPDIAHIRNVYHQLSPSVLWTLKENGIPSVLTIADYKLICPNYTLNINGKVCEACKGGKYYMAVCKRCVRNSFLCSVLLAMETTLHQTILDSYRKNVDKFISPSRFLKDKMVEFGYPEEKIIHLSHFCDSSKFTPSYNADNYVVFFGRIDHRKGLLTTINAIRRFPIDFLIVGDGPEKSNLERYVASEGIGNVIFLGHKSREELNGIIGRARFSILPSEANETFGHVILESFACGKPVIASKIGAIPELVNVGENGLLFEPGNIEDLSEKIATLLRAPTLVAEMGKAARTKVVEKFSPQEHYQKLIAIYQEVGK